MKQEMRLDWGIQRQIALFATLDSLEFSLLWITGVSDGSQAGKDIYMYLFIIYVL